MTLFVLQSTFSILHFEETVMHIVATDSQANVPTSTRELL